MIFKCNIFDCIEFYNKNKIVIDAYIKGDLVEGYTTTPVTANSSSNTFADWISKLFGDSIGMSLEDALKFAVWFLIFTIISFIISLVVLIKHWKTLSTLVKLFGILFLFTPFPLLTTIIVFIFNKPNNI